MYQNYTKTMRSEVDLKDPGENLEGTGEILIGNQSFQSWISLIQLVTRRYKANVGLLRMIKAQ